MAEPIRPNRFLWRKTDPRRVVCPSCEKVLRWRFEWGLIVWVRLLPFDRRGQPTDGRPGTHHGSAPCTNCRALVEIATQRAPHNELQAMPFPAA